jgi:hypothetical protein
VIAVGLRWSDPNADLINCLVRARTVEWWEYLGNIWFRTESMDPTTVERSIFIF